MELRVMQPNDYDSVIELWTGSKGVGINMDDSKENISNYLLRNPKTSFVMLDNGKIVGAIMAGHDGYRGFIHHTSVLEEYRGKGIGTKLVQAALKAIKDDGVNKVVLVVFKSNENGNGFWEKQGFDVRDDLYYRNLRI